MRRAKRPGRFGVVARFHVSGVIKELLSCLCAHGVFGVGVGGVFRFFQCDYRAEIPNALPRCICYRGISLMRNTPLLGPCNSTTPRVLGGEGCFF